MNEPATRNDNPKSMPETQPERPKSMRERIIDAASEQFYAYGIRAVSAEKIIAQVGITKVTFYRYFHTKDDLIVEYLERRAKWERDAVGLATASAKGNVPDAFRIIADGIGAESCSPGFRGCPFINAAAEYSEPDHPVHKVVDSHRRWFKQAIADMLRRIDVAGADSVADELVMLRDGAMVSGYLGDPRTVAQSLFNAGRAVIEYKS